MAVATADKLTWSHHKLSLAKWIFYIVIFNSPTVLFSKLQSSIILFASYESFITELPNILSINFSAWYTLAIYTYMVHLKINWIMF